MKGYCPMGCGQTLWINDEDEVVCKHAQCENPDAVRDLLSDPETEHLLYVREEDFTLQHPLRERLDHALVDCQLHRRIREVEGPPKPGLYRVTRDGMSLKFEDLGRAD